MDGDKLSLASSALSTAPTPQIVIYVWEHIDTTCHDTSSVPSGNGPFLLSFSILLGIDQWISGRSDRMTVVCELMSASKIL